MSREPTTEVDLPSSRAPAPRRQKVEWAALSDVGKVRPNNEDHFLICRLSKILQVLDTNLVEETSDQRCERDGYLLLVADGMGGVAAGEYASAMAVRGVKHHLMDTAKWFFSLDDPDEDVRIRLLRESLAQIDRELIEQARQDPSLSGMGTTLTAAGIVDGAAFIVHVGDSRVYLLRDRQLEQVTQDHTVAQKLLEAGILNPEEAKTHRSRHILTNSLGGSPGVKGEIVKLRLQDGDRLLLCTDGLNDMVSDDKIADILLTSIAPDTACRALTDAALDQGGRDNITVIVANYTETS
jgi:protein phosphatase